MDISRMMKILKPRKKMEPESKTPTLDQWLNRLIEFKSEKTIVDASKQFLYLVEGGMDPSTAFEIVIRYRPND